MIYLFLASGFEEIEALTPVDILRRAGKDIKTVGIGDKTVVGARGIPVVADLTETEFAALGDKSPEMMILPGGMPGTKHLDASQTVERALADALAAGSFIAAICAAPTILGKRGLLAGKRAVCYPGMEGDLRGALLSSASGKAADLVVRDGKFITAAGMGVALPFSLALVEALAGKPCAEKLRIAVVG